MYVVGELQREREKETKVHLYHEIILHGWGIAGSDIGHKRPQSQVDVTGNELTLSHALLPPLYIPFNVYSQITYVLVLGLS
jgi:hypothetical protein